MKPEKIFLSWNWEKNRYVWTITVKVIGENGMLQERTAQITDAQHLALRNGGWISEITDDGKVRIRF